MANSGRSSPLVQLFARSPSDGTTIEDNVLMKSISKCFDPPLEETIAGDNGIDAGKDAAAPSKSGKGE